MKPGRLQNALAGLQKRTVIHDNRRPARRFDPGITIREGGGDAMRRGLPAKRERCARAPASQPSNRLALSAGRKVYTLTGPMHHLFDLSPVARGSRQPAERESDFATGRLKKMS